MVNSLLFEQTSQFVHWSTAVWLCCCYHMLSTQLFLQPQPVPHREHYVLCPWPQCIHLSMPSPYTYQSKMTTASCSHTIHLPTYNHYSSMP